MTFLTESSLKEIADKVAGGERLSFHDGVALFNSNDLNGLGKLADTVRRRQHGRTAYFNVNRHFNPTNVCYVDCKFCGFFRTPRQPDAYTHNIDDSLRIAGQAVSEGATELHITGGLNTKLPFSYFTDLLSSLKQQYPQLHLKAFTMVELDHFTHFYKMRDEDVIQQLIDAGLDSCPGGGAEIFREPTRSMICAHKCDAQRWLGGFAVARGRVVVEAVLRAGIGVLLILGAGGLQRLLVVRPHRIDRRPGRPSNSFARTTGQIRRLSMFHSAGLLSA